MSAINVNSITGRTGTHGPVLTGVTTATNGLNITGGSVGIGTDSPAEVLEVRGDVRISDGSPRLNLYDTNAAGAANATGGFEVFDKDGNRNVFCLSDAPSADNLLLGVTGIERLRITSSGDVGIGTDNPAGRLEVYNGAGLSSLVIQTPATSDAELEFRNTNGGNATWSIGLDYDDSKKFKIAYASANGASLSANELIAISTGGNIELASGAGIDFSATGNGSGSMTSELLDDYEEGTWSPTIDKSSSSPSVSYSIRLGTYTKIGRLVTVFFDVTANITGGGGGARMYGLPYTVNSSMAGYSRVHFRATSAVASGNATEQLSGFAQQGDTYLRLQYDDSGVNGYASGGDANWAASGRVTGYVTYEV